MAEPHLSFRRTADSQPSTTLEVVVYSRTGYDIATYDGYTWHGKHVGPIGCSCLSHGGIG